MWADKETNIDYLNFGYIEESNNEFAFRTKNIEFADWIVLLIRAR